MSLISSMNPTAPINTRPEAIAAARASAIAIFIGVALGIVGVIYLATAGSAVMEAALASQPVEEFSVPEGVELVQSCATSRLLPLRLCPQVTTEVYLAGSDPDAVRNAAQGTGTSREPSSPTPTLRERPPALPQEDDDDDRGRGRGRRGRD